MDRCHRTRFVRSRTARAFGPLLDSRHDRWRSLAVCCSLWAAVLLIPAALQAAETLHLVNGDYVTGQRLAANEPGTLRWKSPHFAGPLTFALGHVSSISYPLPAELPQAEGDFCFELAGGDVMNGQLVGITSDAFQIDSPRFGRVNLRRTHVARFYRRSGADVIYAGPHGLAGWKVLSGPESWREERGRPLTDKQSAALYASLGLTDKVMIDIELSWEEEPIFVVGLGVNETDQSFARAFRIEVWRQELVMLREGAGIADLVQLGSLAGEHRVRLILCLDQTQGVIQAYSAGGTPLGQLALPLEGDKPLPGMRIVNERGDLAIERLRVTRWNGVSPQASDGAQASVTYGDGEAAMGELTALTDGLLTLRSGEEETRIPLEQLVRVQFPPPPNTEPATVRVRYLDDSQVSGEPLAWRDTGVELRSPISTEPLRVELDAVRSLAVRASAPRSPMPSGRAGKLELDAVRLQGNLVEGSTGAGSSCLVWKSVAAVDAVPLVPEASGRIVYRERPAVPPRVTARPQRRQPGVIQNAFERFFGGMAESPGASAGLSRSLFLRSGDTIPCETLRIDEHGLHFQSPHSEQSFVPHERIKAVELQYSDGNLKISSEKRTRLLTLPRLQRESPPTHLIRSTNGDFLRGRIEWMDDKNLSVEVRLESKLIPRSRITHIIWLHEDELAGGRDGGAEVNGGASVAGSSKTASTVRPLVSAVRGDGIRLTFVPERMEQEVLTGTSDLLGACRVAIGEVDELLLGAAIEQSTARLGYHRWRLRPAPVPRYALEGGGSSSGERPAGVESALVGEPAPDFTLEMLDGGSFKLSQQRGKIIVLDFWATWCGPCIQSMPEVERVVSEFADRGVELIAVNLEESPEQIRSMLERHKLAVRVALDIDGAVAAKYTATAIPQTVIINPEGTVYRLYVGGGPQLATNLRTALETLTASPLPGDKGPSAKNED